MDISRLGNWCKYPAKGIHFHVRTFAWYKHCPSFCGRNRSVTRSKRGRVIWVPAARDWTWLCERPGEALLLRGSARPGQEKYQSSTIHVRLDRSCSFCVQPKKSGDGKGTTWRGNNLLLPFYAIWLSEISARESTTEPSLNKLTWIVCTPN